MQSKSCTSLTSAVLLTLLVLRYWEGVVTAAKGDTSAVSAAFAASTEYQTEYAQVNTSGVISQIYQNLFGPLTLLMRLVWNTGSKQLATRYSPSTQL